MIVYVSETGTITAPSLEAIGEELWRTLGFAEQGTCPGLAGEISTTACARSGCSFCEQGL